MLVVEFLIHRTIYNDHKGKKKSTDQIFYFQIFLRKLSLITIIVDD